MTSQGKPTEDDIYCACLSKSLCQISTPVTVGLYAPFGGRVYMLLSRIVKCMREESKRITDKEVTQLKEAPDKPVGWGFVRLLWRLLFFFPVVTEHHQERKSLEFIFVNFSAWQYAGSDRLWAGLVTTLCDRMRRHFGILTLSIFGVLKSKPKRDLESNDKEWVFKKSFCIKLIVILLLLIIGLILILVPVTTKSDSGEEKVSTAFGVLATLVSGSGIIMTVYKLGKGVLISQKQKIERLVNSQKFSSQMGFMNDIKKEVELITDMIQCMEIFQKQRIRVVLQITSLELCAPDKVVGVLDAMNTLLSDRRAPFISILVVDPSIIVTCLECSSSLKGMADNGYMFLNRTVTLPFSVPALGKKTKLHLLRKAVQKTEDLIDWPCRNDATRGTKTGIAESMKLLREELSDDEEPDTKTSLFQPGRCIQETFFSLYSERECLHEYIPDRISQMKQIVNTIPVMVHLMLLSQIPWDNKSAKAVAAWVVLCNQWPCRLSWILQCLEDEEQRGGKDGFCNCLLWEVYKENSKELFALKTGLKNLFDLDGDPEIFQKFLSQDFPFTVAESNRLKRCTVNLDMSIKNKMGLHRGINNLQKDWQEDVGKREVAEKEEKESIGEIRTDICRHRAVFQRKGGSTVEIQKREFEDVLDIQNLQKVGCIVEIQRKEADCKNEIQKREEEPSYIGTIEKADEDSRWLHGFKMKPPERSEEIQKMMESVCTEENQKREEESTTLLRVQKKAIECLVDIHDREETCLDDINDINNREYSVYIEDIKSTKEESGRLQEIKKTDESVNLDNINRIEDESKSIGEPKIREEWSGSLVELKIREEESGSLVDLKMREEESGSLGAIKIRGEKSGSLVDLKIKKEQSGSIVDLKIGDEENESSGNSKIREEESGSLVDLVIKEEEFGSLVNLEIREEEFGSLVDLKIKKEQSGSIVDLKIGEEENGSSGNIKIREEESGSLVDLMIKEEEFGSLVDLEIREEELGSLVNLEIREEELGSLVNLEIREEEFGSLVDLKIKEERSTILVDLGTREDEFGSAEVVKITEEKSGIPEGIKFREEESGSLGDIKIRKDEPLNLEEIEKREKGSGSLGYTRKIAERSRSLGDIKKREDKSGSVRNIKKREEAC
ncbi:NTPase KAP family P-loop domain-containing protein 1 [Discoglossus pictus]